MAIPNPNLTALAQLLAQLPKPARPMPLGPLQPPNVPTPYFGAEPELPPVAPMPARDTAFIRNYAGAEPVRPVERPPSTLDKIMAVLGGFGAGVQGQGPQYLAQLREERERPRREYEARRGQFEERRMRAVELDERRRERQQELLQSRADAQSEREFRQWAQRTGVQDQVALEQLRQAHEVEREARRQRFETERDLEREQRRREDDARQWAGRLGTGPGAAPPHIAKELGLFYANVRQTVSPAAAKWVNAQARRAELLARPATGGGSAAASRREVQDLQRRTAQAVAGINAVEKLAREAMESPEAKRAPILNQMRSMAATLQAQFPELIETGEHNGWPFARPKLRGSQPQPQQQPQAQADPLGILR